MSFLAEHGFLFLAGAGAPLAVGLVLIVRARPARPLGSANIVTAVRFGLACGLSGLAATAMSGAMIPTGVAWAATGIGALGLALDGLDGYIARRLGAASAFGARFDMEVDAFHIMVLAVLAAATGKAGFWVLLSGLLRYAFVAVGHLWPRFETPLPPSWRRKAVAVVQGAALVLIAAPAVAPPSSTVLAALALILLLISFAIDIVWTLRQPSPMVRS
jgi:phosphatidylglycerophosphate synthase